jgi:hypothetical protein
MKRGFYFLVNREAINKPFRIYWLVLTGIWYIWLILRRMHKLVALQDKETKKGEEKLQTASNKLIAGDQKQTGDLGCNG